MEGGCRIEVEEGVRKAIEGNRFKLSCRKH